MWDLLVPSLPLRHAVFSFQASLPASTLLIHPLYAHHPTAMTLTEHQDFQVPNARARFGPCLAACALLATPSLVFTLPMSFWFLSSKAGTIPSSFPSKDLFQKIPTKWCFPRFPPTSSLCILHTSVNSTLSEVLAVFNVYTSNSDLWAIV